MHLTSPARTTALVALLVLAAVAIGCDSTPAPVVPVASVAPAQVQSFSLSPESLRVDRIGMRALKPDGSLDLVFTARIAGPARSLYIASANEKCDAGGVFRASTAAGDEPAPQELGGALELGRMSSAIAVEEGGKLLNRPDGTASLTAGVHDLKLYIPNLGILREGFTLCAYAVSDDGTVAKSRPLKY